MLIYLVVFIVITILNVISEYVYKSNRKGGYIISFICILILSIFAAIRNLSVGTDIQVYGLQVFNRCSNYDSLWNYLSIFKNEYLYYAMNYIIYYLFKNIHILFFIFQLFSVSIVYYLGYKNKGHLWLYVLTYMLIVFNSTFNILRQTMAIFIVMYSFKYINEKKYYKFVIAVILACFFHASAMICFILLPINRISNMKHKYLITILISILAIALMSSLDSFSVWISGTSLISDKYVRYIVSEKNNFNFKLALVKIIMFFVVLLFSKSSEKKESNSFLLLLPIMDFILFLSSKWIVYGYRMSYYMLPFYIILIPKIDESLKEKKGKMLYRICIITVMLIYWIVRYVVFKYDGTIPYSTYFN